MSRERFPFRFGSYSCQIIIDGREMRPISSLTNSVSPQALVEQLRQYGYSPTEVVVDFNILFLDTGRNLVLVDSGWGCCNPKMQGRLLSNLHEAGFKPEDVDLIVLTHGDRDHLGGLLNAEGKPVFPYASYLMSQAAWDWYNAETTLARLPAEFADFYRKVLPLIKEHLRLVEAETEFLARPYLAAGTRAPSRAFCCAPHPGRQAPAAPGGCGRSPAADAAPRMALAVRLSARAGCRNPQTAAKLGL